MKIKNSIHSRSDKGFRKMRKKEYWTTAPNSKKPLKKTYCAFMWFFSRMSAHVHHKHILRLERLLLPKGEKNKFK